MAIHSKAGVGNCLLQALLYVVLISPLMYGVGCVAILAIAGYWEMPPFDPESKIRTFKESGDANTGVQLTPLNKRFLNSRYPLALELRGFVTASTAKGIPTNIWMEVAVLSQTDAQNGELSSPATAISAEVAGLSSSLVPGWSPNGEWLVVPDSRYKGFLAFKSSDLPGALKDIQVSGSAEPTEAKPEEQQRVRRIGISIPVAPVVSPESKEKATTSTKAWHRFLRWTDTDIFEFQAGKPGTAERFYGGLFGVFQCDLRTGKVIPISPAGFAFLPLPFRPEGESSAKASPQIPYKSDNFSSIAPKPRLVITCIPSLISLLANKEKNKGTPLTEQEVLEIRNSATAVALPSEAAATLDKERGYKDIDAEHCWEEWQKARVNAK